MIFKAIYSTIGGHVHCQFFSAKNSDSTWFGLGHLTVWRGPEFRDLRHAMPHVTFMGQTSDESFAKAEDKDG